MNGDVDNKVLVLGASGMLGSAVLRYFHERKKYTVAGTLRSAEALSLLPESIRSTVQVGVDAESAESLTQLFARVQPKVVINCVGVVKQLASAKDPLTALPINAILPHRLAALSSACGAHLVHISTDCVFTGTKGGYVEGDTPDARDLYGLSKYLGEVSDSHCVTLRTSIIGHELQGTHGLIEWFLSQTKSVRGFSKTIFSGLPTVELAKVIHDFVIPQKLGGLYHVSATPIDKFSLLKQVAEIYGKTIEIVADPTQVLDRSLDSTRFQRVTGYSPPPWPELIRRMRDFG
jgi:dTDP-4-dehydrorhamnose reductase